jgi:hypothetical protein
MIFQYGLCPFAPHRAMTKNGIGIGELGVCFVFAPIFERQNGNAFLQDLRSRGGSNFLSSEPLISKYADDQEQDGDDDKVEFPSGAFGDRLGNIHIFGAFEPFGGQFERPGKNQRDDKPDHQEPRPIGSPSSGPRKMERLVWPPEPTARRQPRTRPRPCTRCAALIPRRISSHPSAIYYPLLPAESRQQLTGSAPRSLGIRSTIPRWNDARLRSE